MTDETIIKMKKLTRDHTHKIWEIAKTGDLDSLTGEDKQYAKVIESISVRDIGNSTSISS